MSAEEQVTQYGDTRTIRRVTDASGIISACKLDDLMMSLATEMTFLTCNFWLHASNQGIEKGDWMEHWTKATRPASSGEHWDVAYYVPACYPPLGTLSIRPSGLRCISPSHVTRIDV